jgi:hypothetical protein
LEGNACKGGNCVAGHGVMGWSHDKSKWMGNFRGCIEKTERMIYLVSFQMWRIWVQVNGAAILPPQAK